MPRTFALFLHSDRYDRLYQAVSMVLAASSMGTKCHLFIVYGALASFMENRWDDTSTLISGNDTMTQVAGNDTTQRLAAGFDRANLPSLYDMLRNAREESGGVHVYACSASCRVFDISPEDARTRVDDVVGLHTMMRVAAESDHVLYI